MNAAHWHLVLNHIPVLGVWFITAWMIAALVLRNATMLRSSWVAFVVLALLTIPTYLTGDPAEEIVEHLPAVSHEAIEHHQDSAKIALVGVEALGALSLAALFLTRRRAKWERTLSIATLVLALLCGGWLGYVANLGGQVSHPELRHDIGGLGESTSPRDEQREESEHGAER